MESNDKTKFEEFLKVVPKERISKFFEYLEDHIYPVKLFTDYDDYNGSILTTFENENINNAFRKFDESFSNLKNYLFRISKSTGIKEQESELFSSFKKGIRELWEFVDIFKKEYANFVEVTKREFSDKPIKNRNLKKIHLLRKDLKSEITIGKLVAYNDGSIRYGNDEIKLRNQIKDLCRLFMERPRQTLTKDDIKDHLIHADRRPIISFITISKYVSELHSSLKFYYKKDVIFNQKEEGWYFKP